MKGIHCSPHPSCLFKEVQAADKPIKGKNLVVGLRSTSFSRYINSKCNNKFTNSGKMCS